MPLQSSSPTALSHTTPSAIDDYDPNFVQAVGSPMPCPYSTLLNAATCPPRPLFQLQPQLQSRLQPPLDFRFLLLHAAPRLMYGHSFGGSTAVNVSAVDARVLAAANIDGPYYGPWPTAP